MDPAKLKPGETYRFNEPCTGKTEEVIYDYQTINHYVFKSETGMKWLCHDNVKTNVSELPL